MNKGKPKVKVTLGPEETPEEVDMRSICKTIVFIVVVVMDTAKDEMRQ